MTRIIWLAICVLSFLALPIMLSADEYQDGRHFSVNPGDMMGGMMNPMRDMFGGYDRDRGYYNAYPPTYYPPRAYPQYPSKYAYPGMAHGQPYSGYAPASPYYQAPPGYQPNIDAPNYPSEPSVHQTPYPPSEQAATEPPYRSSPSAERPFHFRPMEPLQAETPPAYPEAKTEVQSKKTYPSQSAKTSNPVESRLKFRPLDQPGYSQ
jgi:hypothetical protein